MTDKNKVEKLTKALIVLFRKSDCDDSDAAQACTTMLLALTMNRGYTRQEASKSLWAWLKSGADEIAKREGRVYWFPSGAKKRGLTPLRRPS